jgi:hypothetical protein
MKFQVRDIVKASIEFGFRLFAVVRIQDGKYYAVDMKNKKRYWLEESQLDNKTGTIPESSPLLLLDEAYDASAGSKYAEERAMISTGNEQKRWMILAMLKPGDNIEVVVNNTIHTAVFVQLNLTKPVRVLRAKVQGRLLDLPLEVVYAEQV